MVWFVYKSDWQFIDILQCFQSPSTKILKRCTELFVFVLTYMTTIKSSFWFAIKIKEIYDKNNKSDHHDITEILLKMVNTGCCVSRYIMTDTWHEYHGQSFDGMIADIVTQSFVIVIQWNTRDVDNQA
jgi:hypothetical protein